MAHTNFQSVDEYIATHPPDVQVVLQRVRSAIRAAIPGAEEVISYQIPLFRLRGNRVIYFAGWKKHYSLYPATRFVVTSLKKELAPYEVNNKGTVRFPLSEPVPARLIARIAKLRVKEVAEAARARAAKTKTKSKTKATKTRKPTTHR